MAMAQRHQSVAVDESVRRDVDALIESGGYSSASEVIQAGLEALAREEKALDTLIAERVRDSLADPADDIPAEDVFAELRERHRIRTEGGR
jgi:antitoxin ParD1/3/4